MSALLSNTVSRTPGPENTPPPTTSPVSPNLVPLRLLVVDESSQLRQMCSEIASTFGFVLVEVETISAARKILERRDTDILMLDLSPSSNEAQSLLVEMKSLCPSTLVIAMSASATLSSAVDTMRSGAFDYLSKPFPAHILTKALERAAKRRCFDVELRKLQGAGSTWPEMGSALGQSVEMGKLYRILSNVSDSSHPVMILGERGTGKELVAKSIHLNGPNRSKQFVSIDCRSISEAALELELFGGSQSTSETATSQKCGLLASPQGGTVFLSEIGDISLDLQRRLVRVLKDKSIGETDGMKEGRLSVRIIAASSRDLIQMINEGRFRLDLYQSLSIVNLKIPPLRGRTEDIGFLAQRFLDKLGQGTGVYRTLSPETLQILKTYEWPENTDELENTIAAASAAAASQRLESDHLPRNIVTAFRAREAANASDLNRTGKSAEQTVVPLAVMEQLAISNALQQTHGDKIAAAKLLGIGKTTLYRKLKEYELQNSPKPISPQSTFLDFPSAESDSKPHSNAICA
jgi:DNA-binding NtrC family response regulator